MVDEKIEGNTDKLNDEWNYHFGDNHRSKIKTIEMIPDKKVAWLVEENYFKNAKDQSEWVGNKIVFEISKQNKTKQNKTKQNKTKQNKTKQNKTQLGFTQVGLVPTYDCYKACQWAWTGFVEKSLLSLITTGKGQLKWYEQS